MARALGSHAARRPARLAVLLLVAAVLGELTGAASDAAVMTELRQALHALRGPWSGGLPGWSPSDSPNPCHWSGVECANGTWVTSIRLARRDVDSYRAVAVEDLAIRLARCGTGRKGPTWVLPPETLAPLAQLRHLANLTLADGMAQLEGGLPRQWGAPRAFPRLKSLSLWVCSVAAPSLEPQPGALPLLESFSWDAVVPPVELPASWGHPHAWPMLRTLVFNAPLAGTLPAAWARGFRRLERLVVAEPLSLPAGLQPHADPLSPSAAVDPCELLPTRRLPPEWGDGFPALRELTLRDLCLAGAIPATWLNGTAFTRMTSLTLSRNQLSGTLPAYLTAHMPFLKTLLVDRNKLTGPLPPEWAHSQLETLVTFENKLRGRAFPPAWVAPGALPSLSEVDLSNNQLTGTLPAHVPWPRLSKLDLSANRLSGSLPGAWCRHNASAADFPRLEGTSVTPQQCHDRTVVSAAPAADRAQAAVALLGHPRSTAAWLPVAVLAVVLAGALGALLLATRQQQARFAVHSSSSSSTYRRLHTDSESTSSESPADVLGPWPGASRAALGALRRRRQRVGSMLRTGGDRVQMAQLGTVPTDMAHRMVPLSRMSLHPPGQVELPPLMHSATGQPAPPASWGWHLGSHSLALPADDLQFVADENGELVVLGEGATGICYLARAPAGDVAVKVFEFGPDADPASVWREVTLLKRCIHPRIVPLYGVARKGALLMLVLRLMRGGCLQRALQDPERHEALAWHNRGLQVAIDIAEALCYLHTELQLMHSDLSGANVLLDEDLRAYISDFGVARVVGQSARSVAGFHWVHAAPEQLLGERCSCAADMYSFGLLLIQLTTHAVVIKRGQWRLPHVPQECSQSVSELIEQCVASDPRERPTAAQALERLRSEGASAPSSA